MWRFAEQTVLRWQPRIAQIQGEDNRWVIKGVWM
jgi:hypothetical protein